LVNAQYNVAPARSLPVKIIAFQRRRIFDAFLGECALPDPSKTILDIGVTSDRSYDASNYLEAWYPHKDKVTASGIDEADFLEDIYPGMTFIKADALDLPFPDQSFDVVHSSAVIEHVGDFKNQTKMISECARVARSHFFITTPNRWFPVEFHSVLPLIHWLPKDIFRAFLKRTGRSFFAEESHLNLMSRRELLSAAKIGCEREFALALRTASLLGWPSNLLLVGRRRSRQAGYDNRGA
jgi:hypothetical protein